MSWQAVAKKDFRDARRSKLLWGVTGIFFLFVIGILLIDPTSEGSASGAMSSMVGVGTFFLPLAVLAMGYNSITGERESGSARYLLGLPLTRLEFFAGKFVGRALVAVLGILSALLIGGVVMGFRFSDFSIREYTGFVVLTLFFTAVWVGISVGISAMSRTRGQALSGTLGIYLLFSVMWSVFSPQSVVSSVVEDLFGMAPVPELYDIVLVLSPSYAYSVAGNVLVRGIPYTGDAYIGEYGGSFPLPLQDWFMLVIMSLWLVVPLVIGYLRFRNMELA